MLKRGIPDDAGILTIDLNCDMGEGMPTDEDIFPLISAANIACGGHAGDDVTMRRSVARALECGVAIGAHPSYPDRAAFGRADILESSPGKGDRPCTFSRLLPALVEQISALQAVCNELGATLRHVKPHGALYNRAAGDPVVAGLIAEAVSAAGPSLILYGLSGSQLQPAAAAAGLRFASEVFGDRTYRGDGALTPRTAPNALIGDARTMIDQVLTMVRQGCVRTTAGTMLPIRADTVCLHGDGDHAFEFAAILRRELDQAGIRVAAPI